MVDGVFLHSISAASFGFDFKIYIYKCCAQCAFNVYGFVYIVQGAFLAFAPPPPDLFMCTKSTLDACLTCVHFVDNMICVRIPHTKYSSNRCVQRANERKRKIFVLMVSHENPLSTSRRPIVPNDTNASLCRLRYLRNPCHSLRLKTHWNCVRLEFTVHMDSEAGNRCQKTNEEFAASAE